MQDFIDRFMTGKKKISAAVWIPIIVSAVTAIFGDTTTASNLIDIVQEYAPAIIALGGGVGYAIIEGINDNARIKVNGTTQAGNDERRTLSC